MLPSDPVLKSNLQTWAKAYNWTYTSANQVMDVLTWEERGITHLPSVPGARW